MRAIDFLPAALRAELEADLQHMIREYPNAPPRLFRFLQEVWIDGLARDALAKKEGLS